MFLAIWILMFSAGLGSIGHRIPINTIIWLCHRVRDAVDGAPLVCHFGLLVLVFNLVVDLGYVVESHAILVVWSALATLAFVHACLQVPLAGGWIARPLTALELALGPVPEIPTARSKTSSIDNHILSQSGRGRRTDVRRTNQQNDKNGEAT